MAMSQRSVSEYPEGCILLFEDMGMRAVATQVPKPKNNRILQYDLLPFSYLRTSPNLT
jgi:hypothetical protein